MASTPRVAVFVFVVLGAIAAIWHRPQTRALLRYVKEELLLVLGTASQIVLPRLIAKLEMLGCDGAMVGFVVPGGYSFNLDGTSIYMAISVAFIAQATDTPFSMWEQLGVLAILLLTSKGGTTVAGGAFIKLAATLQSVRSLPLNGLGLLFGVDRLMATCTALTNVVGNCVATFVIAKWENAFDPAKFDAYLNEQAAGHIDPSGSETPITHIGHSGAEYPVGHTAPTGVEQRVPAAATATLRSQPH